MTDMLRPNPWRRCKTCGGQARKPHYRCAECEASRRARQVKTRTQQKCACGNCATWGHDDCRGCRERRDQQREQFVRDAHEYRDFLTTGKLPARFDQ